MKKVGKLLIIVFFTCMIFNNDSIVASAKENGFVSQDGNTYYYDKDGNLVKNKIFKIDDYYYYTDGNGIIQKTGWTVVNGNKYYFNKRTGTAGTGIKKVGNATYYFNEDGILHRNGFCVVDGKRYYADSVGRIQKTGWTTIEGEKYYLSKSTGAAVVGPKKVGSYYYVFDDDGKMLFDCFYNQDGKKFYLTSKGRAYKGFYTVDGEKTYYFKGNGTVIRSKLLEKDGNIYWISSSGLVSKKGYRKVNGKVFYFDEKTGAAITGVRIGAFNGADRRCYFFDPSTETGYRTGLCQDDNENWYLLSKTNGAGYCGFYSDAEAKKLYYINPETYQVQMTGTATIKVGEEYLDLNVKEDGSLDVGSAISENENDSRRMKLIKCALSQLFKSYGLTELPNSTPIDQIPTYSCTEFVSKVYYESGIDVGHRDIIGRCIEAGGIRRGGEVSYESTDFSIYGAEAGDIMFWNLTNCDVKLDLVGDPWLIDRDGDGICDRIHEMDEFGDGQLYHVHHVGLYLGNGQMLDCAAGRGIVIRDITPMRDTYYVSNVMNLLGD